ncbi:Zinc finger, double-stranded RNA binding protein [Metarhizium rileyi]|uniref:Zinc finger, double-stranded RNA binding protein n=1 Tax=Metarhizium rileyi (strain RCEF 4871) TaxID=1649241 RepID=A0A166ZG06_METRR|nr:Zinc finger, double-stranded RNA binding protein [Metarhizium rileyi RCEF 4871]
MPSDSIWTPWAITPRDIPARLVPQFRTETAAENHMKAQGHYQNYCKACDRHFQNANNFQMHLNSRVHRGSNVPCPFCGIGFTTASGLSHHLETGSCNKAPSLNREKILALIRRRDPRGLITNKQIGWHDEGAATYEASGEAHAWECYLCHGEFGTLHGLNMHLNSPKHKQKVYHCPNKRGACGKQFVSLAGLFHHLESESCAFIRFEKVQQHVGTILDTRRMIAF